MTTQLHRPRLGFQAQNSVDFERGVCFRSTFLPGSDAVASTFTDFPYQGLVRLVTSVSAATLEGLLKLAKMCVGHQGTVASHLPINRRKPISHLPCLKPQLGTSWQFGMQKPHR